MRLGSDDAGGGNLDAAVEQLYGTLAGDISWTAALESVASLLGVDWIMLTRIGAGQRRSFFFESNAPAAVTDVFSRWPTIGRPNDYLRKALDFVPPGRIIELADLVDDPCYRSSAYFSEYARPMGGYSSVGADLMRDSNGLFNVCTWSARRKPLESESRLLMKRLLPHLSRVVSLSVLLERQRGAVGSMEEAWNCSATPMLMLGPDDRIRGWNAAAATLLPTIGESEFGTPELRTTKGEPFAISKLVRRARLERPLHPLAERGTLHLNNGMHFSVTILVAMQTTGLWCADNDEAAAIVVVHDMGPLTDGTGTLLARLYGLTATEARTAIEIASGLDVASIAGRHAVSAEAVRKHLKHIFLKTGTARQAELVRLVLLEAGPSHS
jgi:DNA-binding CsgD family transcriptional regulator